MRAGINCNFYFSIIPNPGDLCPVNNKGVITRPILPICFNPSNYKLRHV